MRRRPVCPASTIERHLIKVYAIAGTLAGLAGIVTAARAQTAQAGMATMNELDAIAAAVIGGTLAHRRLRKDRRNGHRDDHPRHDDVWLHVPVCQHIARRSSKALLSSPHVVTDTYHQRNMKPISATGSADTLATISGTIRVNVSGTRPPFSLKEEGMTVRFGLLGAGRIGRVHAQGVAATRKAKLVAVADSYQNAAQDISSAYGAEVRSVEEIEISHDIDAVIICTPTDTHAVLIERFARAGKAIFCEKPIDLSIERVERCLALVEKTGRALMLGFNRRFDPHFVAVRKAIDEGAIGDVEMVTIVSRDPGPPPLSYIKRSGGIFRDMTIHDFDMARFLLGEEPVSVSAEASVLVDKMIGEAGDYDSVSVILKTASGKHCTISNSRRATYGYDQRIEVLGSRGMVAAENQRPVSIELASGSGYTRPPLHDFFMNRYVDAYANEISAFIAAIVENRAMSPSGADGLAALRLAGAALKSAETGRVVRLET